MRRDRAFCGLTFESEIKNAELRPGRTPTDRFANMSVLDRPGDGTPTIGLWGEEPPIMPEEVEFLPTIEKKYAKNRQYVRGTNPPPAPMTVEEAMVGTVRRVKAKLKRWMRTVNYKDAMAMENFLRELEKKP